MGIKSDYRRVSGTMHNSSKIQETRRGLSKELAKVTRDLFKIDGDGPYYICYYEIARHTKNQDILHEQYGLESYMEEISGKNRGQNFNKYEKMPELFKKRNYNGLLDCWNRSKFSAILRGL